MKVRKKAGAMQRSRSSGSLGSGDGSAPLALCDGSMGGSAVEDGERASCMMVVETLESRFEELRSLRVEVEAQTWSGRKPG